MILGCLTGAYRASPHESTGLTPNLLMLGREVRIPFEFTNGKFTKTIGIQEDNTTWGDHALKTRERLKRAYCVGRKHLEVNAKRRKDFYDTKNKVI